MTPLSTQPGKRRVRTSALSAGFYACLALALPAFASETREFSVQEEAELRAGKLVVRPQVRNVRGSQYLGGMAWQLVDAPPSSVWSALDDPHAYQKFLPAAEEVRLMATNGAIESLYVQHKLGFVSGSYWIRVLHNAPQKLVRVRLDKSHPGSIRDAWAEIRVSPYGNGKTIVSMVIMADLGEGLFVGLIRSNIHTWMLRVPELLKKYVEAQAASGRPAGGRG